MKRITLFLVLSLTSIYIFSQNKALFTYYSNLTTTDSIQTWKWLRANPCESFEKQLCSEYNQKIRNSILPLLSDDDVKHLLDYDIASYQRDLKQNSFYNTTAEKELNRINTKLGNPSALRKEIGELIYIDWNIEGRYKEDLSHINPSVPYKLYPLIRIKLKDKSFRDILYNYAVEILCKLCSYYPKDYRAKWITELSNSLKTLNEADNHKYEVISDEYGWKYFSVDGIVQKRLGYGIRGFLLRRVYMDNIPLSEIKEKTSKLLTRLKGLDLSQNASFLCKYIINNELAYCIGAESNFFMSLANGKRLVMYSNTNKYYKNYYSNVILYRYNGGKYFYHIKNSYTDPKEQELKLIIVDKYLNYTYYEPRTISHKINISSSTSKPASTQQTSKPQLTK